MFAAGMQQARASLCPTTEADPRICEEAKNSVAGVVHRLPQCARPRGPLLGEARLSFFFGGVGGGKIGFWELVSPPSSRGGVPPRVGLGGPTPPPPAGG